MFVQARQIIRNRFDKFLTARVPEAREFTLSNKNIFIFPTAFGLSYLFVVVLLFLLGTNYQNNVIMLLAYLMASFFVTVTLTSFFNLKALKLASEKSIHGFAEQKISVPIKVVTTKPRFDLALCFEDGEVTKLDTLNREQRTNIYWHSAKRGVFNPGRVKLVSEYAFGLLRVWSWLDFGHQLTVFPAPKPITNKQLSQHIDKGEQGAKATQEKDGDEFKELSSYKTGESLARVAWKQLARGQGKLSKVYNQEVGEAKYLSFDSLPPVSNDLKLSYLSYLVMQYAQADIDFGLVLPNQTISVASGEAHKLECLYALAKFPR